MSAVLAHNLFAFDAPDSEGERVHFKLFELFVVASTLYWSWDWGPSLPRLTAAPRPLGIAQHLDLSWLYAPGAGLAAALVVSLAALLAFVRAAPRLGYGAALLGFHLLFCAHHALGKVHHASNFVGLGLLSLAVAPYMAKDAQGRRRFALGTTVFFLGLAYSSAAINKLIASGLNWADGRHLWLWIGEKVVDSYSKTGVLQVSWLQQAALARHGLSSVLLGVGIATEALGFLLWFRRPRPYIALACIGMHTGIYLALNILFAGFISQLLIVALPWPRWLDQLLPRWKGPLASSLRAASVRFA